jgi:hypothetical protein
MALALWPSASCGARMSPVTYSHGRRRTVPQSGSLYLTRRQRAPVPKTGRASAWCALNRLLWGITRARAEYAGSGREARGGGRLEATTAA